MLTGDFPRAAQISSLCTMDLEEGIVTDPERGPGDITISISVTGLQPFFQFCRCDSDSFAAPDGTGNDQMQLPL